MNESLEDVTNRVAEHTITLDMDELDWQKGIAIEGLLATGRELDATQRLTDRAVETQTSEGQFDFGYGDYPREWMRWTDYDVETYKPTANPAVLVRSALEFYSRAGDETYLKAVRRQYEFFDTVEWTTDGGISRRADRIDLFTEILYFLCPFFARYGAVIEDTKPVTEAIREIEVHAKHLQDPHTGLFRHVWQENPNCYPGGGSFWSRGNGWGVAGLLDTLEFLPEDHPKRDTLVEILRTNVETVSDLQDGSGFWHLQLDDPTSALETSGTTIYAYTFKRGIDRGVLDDD